MAPSENSGVGKQHDCDGNERSSEFPEVHGKDGGYDVCLGKCQSFIGFLGDAYAQVHKTGTQNRDGSEAADDDGVRKYLEDAPHSLPDRFMNIGIGVDHDGGTKACFVREDTSLHTLFDGQLDAVTHNTAAGRLHGKSSLEDCHEHLADPGNVRKENDDGSDNIEDHHEGNDLLGHVCDPLKTSQRDKSRQSKHNNARHPHGNAEDRIHVLGDGVDLGHVSDSKGCDQAERSEENGQDSSQRLAVFITAETVLQIIHGSAGPFAALVLFAVEDAQHVFREFGHHTEKGDDPHPEDRTGAAGDDRAGNADDVTRADGSRQGCTKRLELTDGFILRMSQHFFIAEDRSDGIFHPMSDMGHLKKLCDERDQHANGRQQDQCRPSPDDVIHKVVDVCNNFKHFSDPPFFLFFGYFYYSAP